MLSAPAAQLIGKLAPWHLSNDDGNQLDASIYAAQDREKAERALADALKLNGELVADRDRLKADRDRLRQRLTEQDELIATLMDVIEGAVEEQVAK